MQSQMLCRPCERKCIFTFLQLLSIHYIVGCSSPSSLSPYCLLLEGAFPVAGQCAALKVRLERKQPEEWVAGLLFTAEATAWSVPNRNTVLTLTWSRRKIWEVIQSRDYKGYHFFLFSIKVCAKTPSEGSMWLRDLPNLLFWPQGSLSSPHISCPFKVSAANPAICASRSCEVEVTCTGRWNIHFYHHSTKL